MTIQKGQRGLLLKAAFKSSGEYDMTQAAECKHKPNLRGANNGVHATGLG